MVLAIFFPQIAYTYYIFDLWLSRVIVNSSSTWIKKQMIRLQPQLSLGLKDENQTKLQAPAWNIITSIELSKSSVKVSQSREKGCWRSFSLCE